MNILVADDDPLTRHVLETDLTDWGYDVTTCVDGTEAWDAQQHISERSNCLPAGPQPNQVIRSDWAALPSGTATVIHEQTEPYRV